MHIAGAITATYTHTHTHTCTHAHAHSHIAIEIGAVLDPEPDLQAIFISVGVVTQIQVVGRPPPEIKIGDVNVRDEIDWCAPWGLSLLVLAETGFVTVT